VSGFVESGGRFTSDSVAAFDRIWCPLSLESRSRVVAHAESGVSSQLKKLMQQRPPRARFHG
jgi:hypothetical protein